MVTVISRPIGHKLGTTLYNGAVTASGSDALITTMLPHGLSTGEYVYIDSNFESYNEYKYVHLISPTTFKISDSETGALSEYKQDADISFYVSELEHGYQCVHLPIVYELHSDLYPNNELDESYTPRLVLSTSNSNGYTLLNLSVDLYNYRKLDFITLRGVGSLAGPYQIIGSTDANSIIINLAYKASNDFDPYTVEQSYNNYFIGVNVYSGLESGHRWVDEKPYELLATLKFVPDSDGNTKFSIAEIIKSKINTRNNLTLDTLPNNIDFFTEFYISYFEGYDVSDGTTITKFTSEVTTDDFTGQALNAIMPFKSIDAGFLSDYVNSDLTPAQWLTIQDRPAAIVGYYFDMSFINTVNLVDLIVTIRKRFEGYTSDTDVITIPNPGKGVIRLPIDAENGFDEYCISVITPDTTEVIVVPPGTGHFDIADWTETLIPGNEPWTFTVGIPHVILVVSDPTPTTRTSRELGGLSPVPIVIGDTYSWDFTLQVTGSTPFKVDINFFIENPDGSSRTNIGSFSYTTAGVKTGTISFSAISTKNRVSVTAFISRTFNNPDNPITVFFQDLTYVTDGYTETIEIPGVVLTEEICIDIVGECDLFTDGNARLVETGNIRIIE